MNRLSRKFTVLEKVLLLVLCLLLGAAYYYYVYTPLSAELSSVRSERDLLGDLSCSISEEDGKTQVNVSTIVTFYETMVGAVPDAGLPEESGGTS